MALKPEFYQEGDDVCFALRSFTSCNNSELLISYFR